MNLKKIKTENYNNSVRKILILVLLVVFFSFSTAHASTTISGFDGTTIDYDEVDTNPILIAPNLSISDSVGFGESSYIEFSIADAKTSETLGFQQLSSESSISTVDQEISVYNNTIYIGRGGTYEAIGQIDEIKNGQNGENLKIIFERSLPNANFLDGEVGISLNSNDLDGWTILNGLYDSTMINKGLNNKSQGRTYESITGTNPTTIVGPNNEYTYTTDFDYSTGYVNSYGDDSTAWSRESLLTTGSYLNTEVEIDNSNGGTGDRSLSLYSSGGVSSITTSGDSTYGSAFGPVVLSDHFMAKSGENISLDWKASDAGDHYEVYGYLIETKGNSVESDDVYHDLFYSRGELQSWKTSEGTIPNDGEYRFMFINGTYDKTGGNAVGSYLWIDNIKVYGETYEDSVIEAIGLKATYESEDKDPSDTRTINLEVVNANGESTSASATINITGQFSHAPDLTATGRNPKYTNGITSEDILFKNTNSDTIEADEYFTNLTLTLEGLIDNNNEILVLGGEEAILEDQYSGMVSGICSYDVAVSGSAATVNLTEMNLTNSEMNSLVNGLKYRNLLETSTPGERRVKIIKVKDSGGNTSPDINETDLNITSLVNVSNVIEDLTFIDRTATTADLSWTAPVNANSLNVEYSTNKGTSWSNGTHPVLANNSTGTAVTGLSGNQNYSFRLIVTGGNNHGISNIVSAPALSANTLVNSSIYNVSSGQTANETITNVGEGLKKVDVLDNLSKNKSGQIWDVTGISDPVITGDTLVVTAPDGIAQTTYEFTVSGYPVLYNGNGNSSGNSPKDTTFYNAGDNVIVLDNNNLYKSGYKFNGWNTQADGTGTNYKTGDIFQMPGNEVALYAQWEPINNSTYTLSIKNEAIEEEVSLGKDAEFIIKIANTGNSKLSGVTVKDDMTGLNETINLSVGESEVFKVSVATTIAGRLTNTASAYGSKASFKQDSATVAVIETEEDNQEEKEGSVLIVNGESVTAGEASLEEGENERTTAVITINSELIESEMNRILEENEQGEDTDNNVTIQINNTDVQEYKAVLTGDVVKKMENNSFELQFESKNINYTIPAEEIGIDNVAEILDISEDSLEEIEVDIVINEVAKDKIKQIEEKAVEQDYELLFPPVEFNVVARVKRTSGEKIKTTVDKFNNYVKRIIEVPEGVNPNKITTGIIYNEDGTFSHIPTEVFQENDLWYAKLNSLTNSEYSIIWNPVTVKSVENHWSKEAVNDMASRLIIKEKENFDPEANITRGEFAEYISKALGVYRTGITRNEIFKDVDPAAKLADAISSASDYNIILGYPDGRFLPNKTITREEAMVMYSRAMDIVKLEVKDKERINNYLDYNEVSEWAKEDVSKVIASKVFNGTSENTLSPKEIFSYSEAAQAIRNLLIESGLINK